MRTAHFLVTLHEERKRAFSSWWRSAYLFFSTVSAWRETVISFGHDQAKMDGDPSSPITDNNDVIGFEWNVMFHTLTRCLQSYSGTMMIGIFNAFLWVLAFECAFALIPRSNPASPKMKTTSIKSTTMTFSSNQPKTSIRLPQCYLNRNGDKEYWFDNRIHTLGNVGFWGAVHAAMAPVSTKMIDFFAHDGIDIRGVVRMLNIT